jgi:hypothetical protein
MLLNPGPWLFLTASKSAAAATDLCRVGIATITPFERDGRHLLAASLRRGGGR